MSQREANNEQWLEFHPRTSHGRYWTAGVGTLFLVGFAVPLYVAREEMAFLVALPIALIGLFVTIPLFVLAWYFPTMRYRLGRKELVLSYGPIMNDRIPLDAIRSIRRRDLRPSPMSSFRFPGLALFYIEYLGMGRVRMCATSVTKRILLIDIGHRRYGITPEDEMGLVQAIRERSIANIRISENFNPERAPETAISR